MGLSARAYAKHRGCDESTVRQAVREGRIEKLADGTIDPAAADEAWALNSRGSRNPAGGKSRGPAQSIQAIDAEKTLVYTEGLRLKNERLADGLVDREVAERETARLALEFRDRFLAFCQREAPLITAVAQGGDAGDVRRYLDKQCRLELESMSDGILKLVGSRDDSGEDAGADA